MIEALSRGDGEGLAPFLENDLASAAVSLHPPVLTTVLDGEEVRALWAMVSGSGPTCVMLASNSSHQEELVTALAVDPPPGWHAADGGHEEWMPGGRPGREEVFSLVSAAPDRKILERMTGQKNGDPLVTHAAQVS